MGALAPSLQAPAGPAGNAQNLAPFALGSKEFRRRLFQIPFASGAIGAQQKVEKAGWLAQAIFDFQGSAVVTAAGTAGTPNLANIIQNYSLNFNAGYPYRNVDGESMAMIDEVQYAGPYDPVYASPQYQVYNPATLTTPQPIGFIIHDHIAQNLGPNVDKYLLAAHAMNGDLTLQLSFNTPVQAAANTETATITGVFDIHGIFMLDPDYRRFTLPDTGEIQQWIMDTGSVNGTLAVGVNSVNLTPIQGPKYLGLFFKVMLGGAGNVPDPQGATPAMQNVQLVLNTGLPLLDVTGRILHNDNTRLYQRKLPNGWYALDFLSDTGILNLSSPFQRKSLATRLLSQLQLNVNINAGTTIGAGNGLKILKRLSYPVGSVG